jgi:GT2 family glycosyltransferase
VTAREYAIVIPTIGRPSLDRLLGRLCDGPGPRPAEVLVVHDRPGTPLSIQVPAGLRDRIRLLDGPGRGPAAARNVGWRAASAEWVVFLDDDVLPGDGWRADLADDLGSDAAAVQGTIAVPLPADRRPTDWERQVGGLAGAAWISADIAYRRTVLAEVGGFDERFPRAYREDTELAIRVRRAGHRLALGRRVATHPVGPADRWVSLRRQRGNADDALLRRLHGPRWRELGDVPIGRRGVHAVTTGLAAAAILAALLRRRHIAAVAAGGWLASTAEFAGRRIAAGPRTWPEIHAMVATSVFIPPAATAHWVWGWARHRGAAPLTTPSPSASDSWSLASMHASPGPSVSKWNQRVAETHRDPECPEGRQGAVRRGAVRSGRNAGR